ncbi:hypothetical protein GQY15_11840 [Rhodobacter sphaeroides]|uniref:RloB family protein n=1 Tax=Cereibacter sphaeroides TaxID=1063 RepID=UPI001328D404|nr:RloB family protein [Cereibacter sphaeroides]MWP38290.1 hypothetical protein [Cereibacter sphaeroides]
MRSERRRAKSLKELQRRNPQRDERDKVLIVTEGEKTEPDYFNRLISELGLTSAKVRVSGEGGSAPISVFEAAEAIIALDDDYDQIYVVFDKDEHESYQRALSKTLGLSRRSTLKGKTIQAITSIPCFEVWFALHVSSSCKPYTSTLGGLTAGKALVSDLKSMPHNGVELFKGYDKSGCRNFFSTLTPLRPEAIKRSERTLEQAHQRGDLIHFENPSTRVHVVVKALEELSKK